MPFSTQIQGDLLTANFGTMPISEIEIRQIADIVDEKKSYRAVVLYCVQIDSISPLALESLSRWSEELSVSGKQLIVFVHPKNAQQLNQTNAALRWYVVEKPYGDQLPQNGPASSDPFADYANLISNSIVEILDTYGISATRVEASVIENRSISPSGFAGELEFDGDRFMGSLSLLFPREALSKITAKVLGKSAKPGSTEGFDWVAEILNIAARRASDAWARNNLPVQLSITTFRNENEILGRGPTKPADRVFYFKVDEHTLRLEASLRPPPQA